MAMAIPPPPHLAAGVAPKALPALDLLHWSDSPPHNDGLSARISATNDSSAFINASDERRLQQPSSRSLVRTNQPAGGVSTISFGANLTLEESDSSQKRRSGSDSKRREMTGSRIFDHEAASKLPPALPSKKTSVVGIATPMPTHYNIITEDSVLSPKKPASIAEAAKQRELSGTFFEGGGGTTSVRRPCSSAKTKELEGSNIFGRSTYDQYRIISPKCHTNDLNNLSEADHQENKPPRTSVKVSNPAGGRSQISFGCDGGAGQQYGMQSKRQGRNQKAAELLGNNIFEDEVTLASTTTTTTTTTIATAPPPYTANSHIYSLSLSLSLPGRPTKQLIFFQVVARKPSIQQRSLRMRTKIIIIILGAFVKTANQFQNN